MKCRYKNHILIASHLRENWLFGSDSFCWLCLSPWPEIFSNKVFCFTFFFLCHLWIHSYYRCQNSRSLAIVFSASNCFIDWLTNCSLHKQSLGSWLARSPSWLGLRENWSNEGPYGWLAGCPFFLANTHCLIIDYWTWPSIRIVSPAYQFCFPVLN